MGPDNPEGEREVKTLSKKRKTNIAQQQPLRRKDVRLGEKKGRGKCPGTGKERFPSRQEVGDFEK